MKPTLICTMSLPASASGAPSMESRSNAGLAFAEGFSIEEKLGLIAVGIRPEGDIGAGFHHRVRPVWQDVHHLVGSLALIEEIQVFLEIREVTGATGEQLEQPAAAREARFGEDGYKFTNKYSNKTATPLSPAPFRRIHNAFTVGCRA